jgi:hypothetical protein
MTMSSAVVKLRHENEALELCKGIVLGLETTSSHKDVSAW